MEIKTKFNVNSLVTGKYQRQPLKEKGGMAFLMGFEVIDINTQTCMAGTQVFYVCRGIHGMAETKYEEDKKVTKFTDFSAGSTSRGEYVTFREDELIEASKEMIDMITGNAE